MAGRETADVLLDAGMNDPDTGTRAVTPRYDAVSFGLSWRFELERSEEYIATMWTISYMGISSR
jgi:hypothetical protein